MLCTRGPDRRTASMAVTAALSPLPSARPDDQNKRAMPQILKTSIIDFYLPDCVNRDER